MPLLSTLAAGSVKGYASGQILLPPVAGFIALYTADSWTGTQWTDLSGFGNNVTIIGGTPTLVTSPVGNNSNRSFRVLQGSTTASLLWPTTILPATYTLFHVTRHNGTRQRIFTGNDVNWLSGFWGGLSGQAYHNAWLTNNVTDYFGSNWVISTDQNSFYRGYSGGSTNEGTGGGASTRLAINTSAVVAGEQSDWQVAEVIVYNTTLALADRISTENYLRNKYGL